MLDCNVRWEGLCQYNKIRVGQWRLANLTVCRLKSRCWRLLTHHYPPCVWFCLQATLTSEHEQPFSPFESPQRYRWHMAKQQVHICVVSADCCHTRAAASLRCLSSAKGHLAVTMAKSDIHTCFSLALPALIEWKNWRIPQISSSSPHLSLLFYDESGILMA